MVIIINGRGGCGKDTLIESLGSQIKIPNENLKTECYHDVRNTSSIDIIKKIARQGGWNDDKSNKGRKLLHELKKAFTEYNDLPLNDVKQKITFYTKVDEEKGHYETVCFVHIREPEEIEKAANAFEELGIKTATLLVTRDKTNAHAYGNHADDDVDNYNYDYVFDNNRNIEESQAMFKDFITNIIKEVLN